MAIVEGIPHFQTYPYRGEDGAYLYNRGGGLPWPWQSFQERRLAWPESPDVKKHMAIEVSWFIAAISRTIDSRIQLQLYDVVYTELWMNLKLWGALCGSSIAFKLVLSNYVYIYIYIYLHICMYVCSAQPFYALLCRILPIMKSVLPIVGMLVIMQLGGKSICVLHVL